MDCRMTCKCGKRTEIYGAFPRCRECVEIACPACAMPGEEDEERGLTLCKECALDLIDQKERQIETLTRRVEEMAKILREIRETEPDFARYPERTSCYAATLGTVQGKAIVGLAWAPAGERL